WRYAFKTYQQQVEIYYPPSGKPTKRNVEYFKIFGEWIDAIAEPDELMINVGDMLSRHTNNKLKSTIHRVVNPPREMWSTSRYS
ncbi:2OG-Fe(II) oxygenase family protein, partial [Chryseobacterium sp. CH1]|uniref:2OG-Fe(II) oxygenase family protein n=1 Tax=Chryseobacterium sp. CH1 TaxID=713551 RepID=UPI00293905CC